MGKSVVLPSSMMKPCSQPVTFGLHPVRYDRDWRDTLSAYRRCVSPWPAVPEPTEKDYIEHLLLTKDSAPGPDGLPYALWRAFPQQTAAILKDDFHNILAGTLAPPTQVGV